MASNKNPFVKNLITGSIQPLIIPGLFVAGATTAIKAGEILGRTGSTNTTWAPATDADITTGVAVAACEIKSGDRAGYYPIIVPRLGDVFEFAIATAAGTAMGTALYISDSQVLAASGSHIFGYAVGWEHYPLQGHAADDASGDAGTTLRTISSVRMVFAQARSIYNILSMHGA